jgi:MFS family permease
MEVSSDGQAAAHPAAEAGAVADQDTSSGSYAWIVLAMLLLTNIVAFMDRYLMNIVGQPVKEELQLTDWQLGMLNGTAFALSSALVGLPIARLADRVNRATLIAACMTVWSVMTALCGIAGNLWQMMLFRTGVGVGEAGGLPASHSLIADYFPPRKRATAFAIFSIGVPLGALAGSVLGGIMIDNWGWRSAFLLLGAPGVLVAILLRLMVREVPRGRYDPPAASRVMPSILDAARLLVTNRTSRHIILGHITVTMVALAASIFYGPFLVRKFDISYTQMGALLSASFLAGGLLSNLLGGLIADALGRRDRRWYLWVPTIGSLIGIPLHIACYMSDSLIGTCVLLFLASLTAYTYTAPTYSVLHGMVPAQMRATMVALIGSVTGLIGGALGPMIGGFVIDLFATARFPDFASVCPGGLARPGASADLVAACRATLVAGTQWALVACAPFALWPAFHFWRAARTVRSDWQG